MTLRHLVLVTFLGFVIVFAGLLALDWEVWWLTPAQWLSQYQVFHIVAHFGIFAGVVILYHPEKSNAVRLLALVLIGSVSVEWVQFAAGGFRLTRPLVYDTLFDLVVDMTGAAVGWFIVLLYAPRGRSPRFSPGTD